MKRQILDEAAIPLAEAGDRSAEMMAESFKHPESKEGVMSGWNDGRQNSRLIAGKSS
ncbi:hypothetical protein [Kibdelosporangium philippinense]|uniref:hypothetical protein n=1 Tax=Kibdelosporangium philippinense TaxID=211113 RepID=UPI003613CF5D